MNLKQLLKTAATPLLALHLSAGQAAPPVSYLDYQGADPCAEVAQKEARNLALVIINTPRDQLHTIENAVMPFMDGGQLEKTLTNQVSGILKSQAGQAIKALTTRNRGIAERLVLPYRELYEGTPQTAQPNGAIKDLVQGAKESAINYYKDFLRSVKDHVPNCRPLSQKTEAPSADIA